MDSNVDESLYSRQLYVLGTVAMQKLSQAEILVSGMKGLGVEIAKNVILGGAKAVTIQDSGSAEWSDLSSQFYLSEADIGKNRAEASVTPLSELNSYVKVDCHTGPLTDEFVRKFKVVVLTNSDYNEQLWISDVCRSNEIYFILADTKGVFGQMFCDFGDNFTVTEPYADSPAEFQIESITKDKEGLVTCTENVKRSLDSDDLVTFSGIKGMTELNESKPHKIKILGTHSFSIGDTSTMNDYIGGGAVTEVRSPLNVAFKPLREALLFPQFVTDFAKVSRAPQLHFAFRVLHEFRVRKARLPRPRSQDDINEFLGLANEMMNITTDIAKPSELDVNFLSQFSSCAAGDLAPIQSVIGGIAAQEVMKACSGKFKPIEQWFYFDAAECLDGLTQDEHDEQTCAPRGCRYDGQIAVFGEEFQRALADAKYFLVGAGALGCEYLKNWAVMGLGHVVVTDMDHIEKSNLNRQFLFRLDDIGKSKAVVAAAAAKKMNTQMQVTSHNNRVGVETEDVYDDEFYEGLNGVANALDNVEARRYVDSRCVYYGKPLLECGTNGVKASQQVIIPHLTQCYSDMKDAPDKTFPICTLKNFPSVIEHTLQWSRDQFEGLFKLQVITAREFLTQNDFVEKTKNLSPSVALDKFQAVVDLLQHKPPQTFVDCIRWARELFQENYHNQIRQLLHSFPPDSRTPSGAPFWSGSKRCPHPLDFDQHNATHRQYVTAAANLYSRIHGLKLEEMSEEAIGRKAAEFILPAFTPREGVRIAATDEEEQQNRQGNDAELNRLVSLLPDRKSLDKISLCPVDFEKDDDTNFHMDFIVAASNLRAENYEIPSADRMKSKLIAGRIIPAIATTTSMIVGLICLEFYKVQRGLQSINLFKNGFVNLSVPMFAFVQPLPPKMFKYNDKEFSVWDRFDVDGDITLQQLIDHMKERHGLSITFLGYGICGLYGLGMTNEQDRLNIKISKLVEMISKKAIPAHVRSIRLIPGAEDDSGEDIEELPYIKYNLRNRE